MKERVNQEIKKILGQVKAKQAQFQALLNQRAAWVDEAKKYATQQRKEVKKILRADLGIVKEFVEKERKGFEDLQKRLPSEVKKLKKFADQQRKELEKLLGRLGQLGKKAGKKAASKTRRKPAASAKKSSAQESAGA